MCARGVAGKELSARDADKKQKGRASGGACVERTHACGKSCELGSARIGEPEFHACGESRGTQSARTAKDEVEHCDETLGGPVGARARGSGGETEVRPLDLLHRQKRGWKVGMGRRFLSR